MSSTTTTLAPTATILLIDDDESVRRITARILRREGYAVSDWGKPEDALAMLEASDEPIALLLTDTVMPRIGGGEAAARVSALRPGTPVVFMSGYEREALAPSLLCAANCSFLSKPFRAIDLLACIADSLACAEVNS
jgi:two-component system, cell cycle sensor histidine kinase and response regulator CckA